MESDQNNHLAEKPPHLVVSSTGNSLEPAAALPTPEQILEVANRLRRVRHTPSAALVKEFCFPAPHGEPSNGACGCSKFHACSIHPAAQKGWTIEQIKSQAPHVWAQLQADGCLRCHIDEMPELKTLLREGKLGAGDFYGALTKGSVEATSPVIRKLGARHCANHYCAVPELLDSPLNSEADVVKALSNACPVDKVKMAQAKATERLPTNRHRLLACRLTRARFLSLQRQLGVATISPVILLPGDGTERAQIVYVGKNQEADFQFVSISPDSFGQEQTSEFPQAQVRLHAPLLVRHHFGSEAQPDNWGGQRDTLKWLSERTDPTKVSPLEWSLQCRYIPSGEFSFLCLMWLWTGERSSSPLALDQARDVALEMRTDAGTNGNPMLLQMLTDLGLANQLQEVFGQLRLECDIWLRRTTRLEDFVSLGFVTSSDLHNSTPLLTEKAGIFSRWLQSAVHSINQTTVPDSDSPFNRRRLRPLLALQYGPIWTEVLTATAASLCSAVSSNDALAWLTALSGFLDKFSEKVNSVQFRRVLRTDGFPVYPLVHLTMLLGIRQPLDWLALPLGGTIVGSESSNLESIPQGAAYVLALHQPDRIASIVHALTTILEIPVSAYASEWAEYVITETRTELAHARAQLAKWGDAVVCPSGAMQDIYGAIGIAANSRSTVLILGETGTGKEVAARHIHRASPRALNPFVAINVTELSDELLEDKLFGHCKGAYTGAQNERKGLIATAEGGTLFFDEVGELSSRMQVKLLRFLQERTYQRIGENDDLTADVRIIAATNMDLDAKVREGAFRQDLLYRLDVVRIELPPLRNRLEDLPDLFEHLVRKHAMDNGRPVPRIARDAVIELAQFDWPGNVRQLESLAQRAVLWCAKHSLISGDYIRSEIARMQSTKASAAKSNLRVLADADAPSWDAGVMALRHALRPNGDSKAMVNRRSLTELEKLQVRHLIQNLTHGDEQKLKRLAKELNTSKDILSRYCTDTEEPSA